MSSPYDHRPPGGGPDDNDLERLLRASLNAHAEDRPDPTDLSDRVLARLADPAAERRSRRRWTRAGAPLMAAASVAAVVAAGVVGTAVIRTVHDHHGSETAATAGRRTVTATAHVTVTPSGTLAPSTSTSTAAEPVTVGADFRVRDLSYIALGTTGFALGTTASCTAACAGTLATSSDEQTWTVVNPKLPFPVGTGSQDVQSLRFADAGLGYAFGPSAVWLTTDGGQTWNRTQGNAVGLEVANGTAARVSASASTCTSGCDYTVSTADLSTSATTWTEVTLPAAARGTKAFLVRGEKAVYVATTSTDGTSLFYSPDDGVSWQQQSRGLCVGGFGANGISLVALASSSNGAVMALCSDGRTTSLQVSSDHGAHFDTTATNLRTSAHPAVVALDGSHILLSADGLYLSANGGKTFAPVATDFGETHATVVFLGAESDRVAHWVCGNGSTIQSSFQSGVKGSWNVHNFV